MKNKFIKIMSIFLSAIMMLSFLTSCSYSKDGKTGSDASSDYYGTDVNGNLIPNNGGSAGNNPTNPSNPSNPSNPTNPTNPSNPSNPSDVTIDTSKGLPLYSNGAYNLGIVISASANAFDKSFSNNVALLFSKLTGEKPPIYTDATKIGGPAILIGKTTYSESTALYNQLGANQGKAMVSGNKYVIAYTDEIAANSLYQDIKLCLTSKATKTNILINSEWNCSYKYVDSTTVPNSNIIFLTDQISRSIVFYDFNKYSPGKTLDDLEIKSLPLGDAAGLKYREGTVFGNVIILAGANSVTGIYNTSGGKIWNTSNPGKNPHSVEILPSGNLVVASSTDDKIRFFKTSALKNDGSVSYTDYTLDDAHGVLWDPTYKVLWAIGNDDLYAYRIEGSGTNEKLVKDDALSVVLGPYYRGGHDLSPDYTDKNFLYLSLGYRVIRYNKQTKERETLFTKEPNSVKGFSNNPSGNIFYTGITPSTDSWLTNKIHFWKRNNDGTYEKITVSSSKRSFYKSRTYCGAYQ